MGFSAGVKGYRLWCLESKKMIVSRDVTFDESSMLNKVNPNSSDTSQQVEYTPKQVEFEEAVVIPTTNTTNDSPTEEEESDDEEVPPQEPSQQSEPIAVRRTRRENKKPARFADMVAYALPVVDDVPCVWLRRAKKLVTVINLPNTIAPFALVNGSTSGTSRGITGHSLGLSNSNTLLTILVLSL
ncbi:hypothetical protein SASPL_117770 [Salvia splendens]|uniref:Retroviral polymerase SH3-like domain-containing protein n=1 Tax=Salvia splendens TaxID=180675 RepID=A0A8X8Y040_SALSN|nr:hypothetical protein SASPL_117770 [Salvia splendens]